MGLGRRWPGLVPRLPLRAPHGRDERPAVPRRWDLRAPGDPSLHASGDGDAAKDAEIERRFYERNRAAYEWLRARGLLPPEGANLGSQDINEFLLKGGADEPSS